MLNTTVGKLVVEDALPEGMKDWAQLSFNKKTLGAFMSELAQKHPEEYRDVTHKLLQIARRGALESGSNSFGLKHIRVSPIAKARREKLSREIEKINEDDSLSDEARTNKLVKTIAKAKEGFEAELMAEAKAEGSPLERMISSGARGNPGSLASLRGGDFQYVDSEGKALPIPIAKSYGEGLDPVSYWAGSFGARQGLLSAKFCLSADTKVLMSDYTEKAISQIRSGEVVMGADIEGNTFPVRVIRVYDNGPKDCFKYSFRIGSTKRMVDLVATEDHLILAQIRTRDMGVYDQLTLSYKSQKLPLRRAKIRKTSRKNVFVATPVKGERKAGGIRESRALLAGLMLGDGCMSPSSHGGYTFSCADELLIKQLGLYLANFNLQFNKAKGGNHNYTLAEIKKSARVKKESRYKHFATGILNPTKSWLRYSLGDRLAHEKELPEDVWRWDEESICQLLAGLYSTDGSIRVAPSRTKEGSTISISFCSTSQALIVAMRRLLELRLGIWCSSISVAKAENSDIRRHDLYAFKVSHAECVLKFYNKIPLIGRKALQLHKAIKHLQIVPRNSDIGFKIYSRDCMGELPTYDLEVDNPSHLFVLGNGLIVSNSTAESGYFAKRLQQAAHRLLVTGIDEDHERETDEIRGMPADSSDPHNEGSLLAHPTGGYAKNTILTPKILQDLQKRGIGRILVRSPIVGGAKDGGLLARDVGIRESGNLPHPGSLVGLLAAQSIAERLSQQALGAKHLGGIAGKGVEQLTQGFPLVEQLVDIPKAFKGGATHAQTDGIVQAVHEAPAGGMYVTVDDHDHYVPMGHLPLVGRGDAIEAGDMLSTGIPNPSEIVRHKGIGEGRRYFTHQLAGVLQQAGVNAHRRNVELVARAMIDHVKMNDEFSDWLPGDVVSYQTLEKNWHPREGFKELEPKAALGHYLEKPVLHYTVGTKIQPSMLKDMEGFGVKKLVVHEAPPPFEPLMVRSEDSLHHDPDWVTQMYGSGLKKNLLKSVHRGATSDEKGTSFVPSLAKGVNFGLVEPFDKLNKKMGEEKQAFGWDTIPKAVYNYGIKPMGREIVAPGVATEGATDFLDSAGPALSANNWASDASRNPNDWTARYLFQQGLGPGSKGELNDILTTPFSTPNQDIQDNVYVDPNANIMTRMGQGLAASGVVGPSYTSAGVNTAVNAVQSPLTGVTGQAVADTIKGRYVDPLLAPLFQNHGSKEYNKLYSQISPYSNRKDFQDRFHAAENFAQKYLDQEGGRQNLTYQPWDTDNGTGQTNRQKFRALQAPIIAQYARGEIGPAQFDTALREAYQQNGMGEHNGLTSAEDFAALEQAAPNIKPEGGMTGRVINESQTAFDQQHQGQIDALAKMQGQSPPAPQQPSPQAGNTNLISSEFNKPLQQAELARQQQRAQEIAARKEQAAAQAIQQQEQELQQVRDANPADPNLRGQQIAAQFTVDHPELGLGGSRQDEMAREQQNTQQFIAQHPAPKLNAEEQAALAKARSGVTQDQIATYGPRQDLGSMQREDLRREAAGLPRKARSLGEIAGASLYEQPLANTMTSPGQIPHSQTLSKPPSVATKPATPPIAQPPKMPTPPGMAATGSTPKLPLVPGGTS